MDLCDDATEEICRRHAREDLRVEVQVQPERLGWARNLNVLLDRVDTEFSFFLSHDDLIAPTYVERLVAALRERPDAASANCNVQCFGGSERTLSCRGYEGSAAERLLTYLVPKERDPLDRSMIRTARAGHLRLISESTHGFEANHPYLMGVVAAGPAVHVDETLYRRWHTRHGGLTRAWHSFPLEEVIRGHRLNARAAVEVIDDLDPGPAERACLLFGLFLFMSHRLPRTETWNAAASDYPLERVVPEVAGMDMPAAVRELPDPLRVLCAEAYERVLRQTAKRALGFGDHDRAIGALERLARRHPDESRSWARLARALGEAGRAEDAADARRKATELRRMVKNRTDHAFSPTPAL